MTNSLNDGSAALAAAPAKTAPGATCSRARPALKASPRAGVALPFNRLAFFVRLARTWLLVPGLIRMCGAMGWVFLRLTFRVENYLLAPLYLARWRQAGKEQLICPALDGAVDVDRLGLQPAELTRLKARARKEPRVVIGEFDQDGFLLSEFGPIDGIPCVTRAEFLPRFNTSVKLVLANGSVVVEKQFPKAPARFVREVTALRKLNAAGCCCVPVILGVDCDQLRLTIAFIQGKVLREELANAGAILRDRAVAIHPEYQGLSEPVQRLKRIEAGRKVLGRVVTDDFVDHLYRRLQEIHTAGVTLMDIKYGNILTDGDSGQPRFVDFDQAAPLAPWSGLLLLLLRDRETEQFNLHFGTQHLTYTRARVRLGKLRTLDPVYFGYGLSLGQARRAKARDAVWRSFVRDKLPDLTGKRVLCLGGGSAFEAIQFLREGAERVVIVEGDAQSLKQATLVHETFEWVHNRRYALQIVPLDLLELAGSDPGQFDFAFVPSRFAASRAHDLTRIVRQLRSLAPVLIWQSALQREQSAPPVQRRLEPLLGEAQELIQRNGFHVGLIHMLPFAHEGLILAEVSAGTG